MRRHVMSYRFLLVLAIGGMVGQGQLVEACPAPPGPIPLRQPDGRTFQARLEGDERYIHVTTLDGYTIVHDRATNAWFYAVLAPDGLLRPSNLAVGAGDPRRLGIPTRLGAAPALVRRYRSRRLRNPLQPIVRAPDLGGPQPQQPQQVSGTGTPLVILADFDYDPTVSQHVYTQSQFANMLFSTGTYSTGSMNDYFLEISYGTYGVQGDVVDWVTAPESYAYYCNGHSGMGSYPQNSQGLCGDLVDLLDPVIDFSDYDGDDDGYVDGITIVFEGIADGSPDLFWPHAWAMPLWRDGVWVYRYNIVNEQEDDESMAPIGTFCHEWGHVLGAPDLYDYDPGSLYATDDDAYPVSSWCLMAYGGYNYGSDGRQQTGPGHMCGYVKYAYMGWLTPTEISPAAAGQYTVTEAETTHGSQTLYRVPVSGSTTEYFYIENRNANSAGATFDKRNFWDWLLDSGLLIYHVDQSLSSNDGPPTYDHYMVWTEDPGAPVSPSNSPYETKFDAAFSQEDEQTYLGPGGGYYCSSDGYGGPSGIAIAGISASGQQMTFWLTQPTAVGVWGGTAVCRGAAVELAWELGPLGQWVAANVLRCVGPACPTQRLTPAPVMLEEGGNRFVDPAPAPGSSYQIELLDASGGRMLYGPLVPR